MAKHSMAWFWLAWLGVPAGGCHSSPVPARQQLFPESAQAQPTVASASRDTAFSGAVAPDAGSADADTPKEVTADDAPTAPNEYAARFNETDFVFHVINDTGADVFVYEEPFEIELHGKLVKLHPGCGSYCPSCACKECPYEPRKIRRIPQKSTWNDGWDRHVYIAQTCGGMCPCIRRVHAQAGTYSVKVHGRRAAKPLPAGNRLDFEGHLDDASAECQASVTFPLRPGGRADLKLSCEQVSQ